MTEFKISNDVQIFVKNDLSCVELLKKVHEVHPDIVVCSGWMDKDYLKSVKSFKKQILTVLTLDNHWTGALKQKWHVYFLRLCLQITLRMHGFQVNHKRNFPKN